MSINNISFFIPAYNCSKTIEASIDSIMKTNFIDGDELIVVNDSSSDNTNIVLYACLEKYPDIIVINHLRNKGGAGARNTAVENATNNLLFCLDSDNILADYSIKDLKRYLLEQNADVASFQHQHFFQETTENIAYSWSLPTGILPIEMHLNGDNVPGQHGNYLFTKKSWHNAGGYTEGTGALDTATFGLKQALTEAKFVVLENTHYFHRLDEKSYWLRDAEANIWSVSLKVTYALIPYVHLLDERFVDYIFGKGRYNWFYNLKKRPILLSQNKANFYSILNYKIKSKIYPRPTLFSRVLNKLKNFG